MPPENSHPLDVDLLQIASGDMTDEGRAAARAHLKECLICRIRLNRILGAQLPQIGNLPLHPPRDLAPSKSVLERLQPSPARVQPEPDQLWLGGDEDRLMVWVRAVRGDIALCHPVTLDVEMADDETLIVAESESPLAMPLAVWTALSGDVRLSSLKLLIGDLQIRAHVDAVQRHDDLDPSAIGSAITESTDERFEYRQLLADHLAELSGMVEEDEEIYEDDFPEREARRLLSTDLPFRRGPGCRVGPVVDPDISALAEEVGWRLVTTVREMTCLIVIVSTRDPEHLADSPHAVAVANEIIRLASASAMAICSRHAPFETILFDPFHLTTAVEVPEGELVGVTPWGRSLPIVDALFKYLEAAATPTALEATDQSVPYQIDLDQIVSEEVRLAIRAKKTARTPIGPKKRAQESLLSEDEESLSSAIQDTAAGRSSLAAEIRRIASSR